MLVSGKVKASCFPQRKKKRNLPASCCRSKGAAASESVQRAAAAQEKSEALVYLRKKLVRVCLSTRWLWASARRATAALCD